MSVYCIYACLAFICLLQEIKHIPIHSHGASLFYIAAILILLLCLLDGLFVASNYIL